MLWPFNIFLHPLSLKIHHLYNLTQHDSKKKKGTQGAFSNLHETQYKLALKRLTVPPCLKTKINKHADWRQFSRHILEIISLKNTQQGTHSGPSPQAATTSDEVVGKRQHIHHSLPENNVSFTPLSRQEYSHSEAIIGATQQLLVLVPCSGASLFLNYCVSCKC